MNKKIQNEILKTASKILSFLGFDAKTTVTLRDDIVELSVDTEPAALLIGKRGQNLRALERVLQVIFYSKLGNGAISADVAGFRQKRLEDLERLTKITIEEVLTTKTPKTLTGLSAAERKTVHLAVSKNPNLTSESQGEGANRVLIIKPVNL